MIGPQKRTQSISASRRARLGVVLLPAGRTQAAPEKSAQDPLRRHTATITNQNMASPDVVCQPCGSALGAPTKECSTAHKTLFLPKNGGRDAPTSVTRGRNGFRSRSSKVLTSTAQPLSRCIATSRPSEGAAIEKFFKRCRRAASTS